MSQIDVHNAKVALTARLRLWGLEGDLAGLAGGFIDDLVARGWQMSPNLEQRPQPILVAAGCRRCGQEFSPSCCDYPTQKPPARDVDLTPVIAELRGHLAPMSVPSAPRETHDTNKENPK